jgi:phage terminase small subunit
MAANKNLTETEKLEKLLYKEIKGYMVEHALYEPVDEIMINEAIFMIVSIEDAKDEIRTRGVNIERSSGSTGITQIIQNPAVGTYNSLVKNLGVLMNRLQIPPEVRKNIMSKTEEDEFDQTVC